MFNTRQGKLSGDGHIDNDLDKERRASGKNLGLSFDLNCRNEELVE